MYNDTADVPENLGKVDTFQVIVDSTFEYGEGCGVTLENHTGTGNGYFSYSASLPPDEAEALGNLLIRAAQLYRRRLSVVSQESIGQNNEKR